MTKFDLYMKDLVNCKLEKAAYLDIELRFCGNRQDKLQYTKVFMKGFDTPLYKFVKYFLDCYITNCELYLIFLNNDIVGCCALDLTEYPIAYLYDFTVAQEFRGQGLSKRVLGKIYNVLLDCRREELYLYVKKDNEIAINLYKSEGFEKVRE